MLFVFHPKRSGQTGLFFKHMAAALGVSVFAFVMALVIYKLVSLVIPLYHDGTYIDGEITG